VTVMSAALCVVKLCSLMDVQHFRGTYCWGWRVSQGRKNQVASVVNFQFSLHVWVMHHAGWQLDCEQPAFIDYSFWKLFRCRPVHLFQLWFTVICNRQYIFSPCCNFMFYCFISFHFILPMNEDKRWNYPWNSPWRPIGLWDIEAPAFSRQSAHKCQWTCHPCMLVAL
jgi:hypothetical protein